MQGNDTEFQIKVHLAHLAVRSWTIWLGNFSHAESNKNASQITTLFVDGNVGRSFDCFSPAFIQGFAHAGED